MPNLSSLPLHVTQARAIHEFAYVPKRETYLDISIKTYLQ